MGTVQPFRYRGYVYDVETALYYLRSRYYDPVFGRFISEDVLANGNLYQYCLSNPIKYSDHNGNIPSMFSGMGVGNLLLIADGTANHKHGVQALNYYQTITGTKANGGGNNLDIITDLKTMRNTVKNACKNV